MADSRSGSAPPTDSRTPDDLAARVEQLTAELQEVRAELKRSRQLEAMRRRFDLYLRAHEVTDGDLRVARATLDQYVGPEHLEDFRQADDEVLVKILNMQRIYELLMVAASEAEVQGGDVPGSFNIRYDRWLEELVWIPEFQLAHRRQARYYPAFAQGVSALMYQQAMDALRAGGDSEATVEQGKQLRVTAVGQAAEELYLRSQEDDLSGEEEEELKTFRADTGIAATGGRLGFVNAMEEQADHAFWARYFTRSENSA